MLLLESLIEILFNKNLIDKKRYDIFVKKYGQSKVNITNLIKVKVIDIDKVNDTLAEEIRLQNIKAVDLENINGIDVSLILKKVAKDLKIDYTDLNDINYMDLKKIEIDFDLLRKFPMKQLERYNAIPLCEKDGRILIAFENPMDFKARDTIGRLLQGKTMDVSIAKSEIIKSSLKTFKIEESVKNLVIDIKEDLTGDNTPNEEQNASSILQLINIILKNSIDKGASDIHIEAREKESLVRNRIDGELQKDFTFERFIFGPLSSRIKLLAQLDISEKRKPQDGRFTYKINNLVYDFRLSTLPTLFGESIVMRILDKSKAMVKLEDSGMHTFEYQKFKKAINSPYGIVLVTGPTGSGKTTTLYGALNAILKDSDKVITVEDPVEYQMDLIQQVQINIKAGLGFPEALKSILRQDPDKIMIGEIRDHETLRIAIQAALTGHLVLSTLHTNDAISAINRIVDMGIENYLVSGAINAIQGQRLLRKICVQCKKRVQISSEALKKLNNKYLNEKSILYYGEGCTVCNHTGYLGREMISEVLVISEGLSKLISIGASKEEMLKLALQEGFRNMFANGIDKVNEGKTTIEEVFRVAKL